MIPLSRNSIVAIILVLVLVVGFIYYKYGGREKKRERLKKGKSRKKPRLSRNRREEPDDEDPDEDMEEPEENANDDDYETAEELFNLVHEAMCQGMQRDDFEEQAGDLAGDLAFIELKQLYNKIADGGGDPEKEITVDDYAKVIATA